MQQTTDSKETAPMASKVNCYWLTRAMQYQAYHGKHMKPRVQQTTDGGETAPMASKETPGETPPMASKKTPGETPPVASKETPGETAPMASKVNCYWLTRAMQYQAYHGKYMKPRVQQTHETSSAANN